MAAARPLKELPRDERPSRTLGLDEIPSIEIETGGARPLRERVADELRSTFDPARIDALEGRTPWREEARPEQLPPDDDELGFRWFVWLLQTGRGWGKTRSAGEWFYERGAGTPGRRMLLAGRTPSDVRDYALNGAGGLLTHHGDELEYEPSKRLISWPNGSEAIIRSGANPAEFRGFGGDTIWLDEFCAWQYPERSWRNLMLGAREGDPRICISTTPRDLGVFHEIRRMDATVVVRGSTLDNEANLAPSYIENVVRPLIGTRVGRREVEGEIPEEVEGALWSHKLIDEYRIELPESMPPLRTLRWLEEEHGVRLSRIVLGVDPSGGSADVGIVVVGLGTCRYCDVSSDHAFVLADATCEPRGVRWAEDVVATYNRWAADRVLGERNYGGDMVENTIRTVDGGAHLSYEDVNATRGKTRRAEPVASLYEQGKVHHVGGLPEMEDEMTSYVEGESDWSPNRMDGLVWALTKLYDLESRKRREPKERKVTPAVAGA